MMPHCDICKGTTESVLRHNGDDLCLSCVGDRLNQLGDEIASLESERDEAQSERDASDEKIYELESDLETARENERELNEEIDELKEQVKIASGERLRELAQELIEAFA